MVRTCARLVWYNHPLHKEEESGDSRIVQLVIHCRISAVTALNRMKPYSSALSKHVVVNIINAWNSTVYTAK